MKTTIKEMGFAVFFLIVIALVAVEAAEASEAGGMSMAQSLEATPGHFE